MVLAAGFEPAPIAQDAVTPGSDPASEKHEARQAMTLQEVAHDFLPEPGESRSEILFSDEHASNLVPCQHNGADSARFDLDDAACELGWRWLLRGEPDLEPACTSHRLTTLFAHRNTAAMYISKCLLRQPSVT